MGLQQHVATHEFAFQVLAEQAVRFNEFHRYPLLKALDWLETNFRPYNPEQELQVGLFRVPVPLVDMAAFREAIANALIHRDYHRIGAVHVRLENEALAQRIQRDVGNAKRTLEALTEAGLVEAHGNTRGRSYTLSSSVYSVVSDKAAYTRQVGFGPIQHEQMVLSYIRQHGQIKRGEVMDLCRLSQDQAKELLRRMVSSQKIVLKGAGRGAMYLEFPLPIHQ